MLGGNSGAIVRREGGSIIKSAIGEQGQRLQSSHEKNVALPDDWFEPLAFCRHQAGEWHSNQFIVRMPHISGPGIVDWCGQVPLRARNSFLEKILAYLFRSEYLSELSEPTFLSNMASAKLIQMGANEQLVQLALRVASLVKEPIPLRTTHGDLTLANVIFGNEPTLIDVSTVWLDSPLVDAAKLLQECEHHWSARFSSTINREYIAFCEHLRHELLRKYQGDDFMLCSILNDMRLLPYERSAEWRPKIEDNIRRKLSCFSM
jgi:hypothetical protein